MARRRSARRGQCGRAWRVHRSSCAPWSAARSSSTTRRTTRCASPAPSVSPRSSPFRASPSRRGSATPAARWERATARLLEGEKGTALHLQLRLPGGAERGASVTRAVALGDPWPLEHPALEGDTLPGGVAWVRINALADPDVTRQFDRAFPDFANVTGMILDLREHGGSGVGGREAGYQILARLVEHAFLTSRWRTPQYRPAYRGPDMPDSAGAWFTVQPDTIRPRADRPRFKGPVAVLASPRTAGAAEDLLVAFPDG